MKALVSTFRGGLPQRSPPDERDTPPHAAKGHFDFDNCRAKAQTLRVSHVRRWKTIQRSSHIGLPARLPASALFKIRTTENRRGLEAKRSEAQEADRPPCLSQAVEIVPQR